MSNLITYDQVVEALRALPDDEKNPSTCVYTNYDDKHCIVGQIIENFGGVPPAWGSVKAELGL